MAAAERYSIKTRLHKGEPARRGLRRWYVPPALRGRFAFLVSAAAIAAFAGCGGGERQDENEPEGNFAVEVMDASFPDQQQLAQSTKLSIMVRNAGDETVPNIAVTLAGLDYRATQPALANPERPQFAINALPREIGGFPEAKDATPLGCDTAYLNTWACGPLEPGKERTFSWSVTAVRAGDYEISYRVAAGLDGKARAVAVEGGEPTEGSFTGTVSDDIPEVRVAKDGNTVVIVGEDGKAVVIEGEEP